MIIFTCKDTFEDMMSCIYTAWASRLGHKNIRLKTEPIGNLELFCDYRHVDHDPNQTASVIRSIQKDFFSRLPDGIPRCHVFSGRKTGYNLPVPDLWFSLWAFRCKYAAGACCNESV